LEGRPPDVVIEISSISTRARDHREKRAIYAGLGVAEYILYDPVPAARRSPLTLLRLDGDAYAPVRPEADGSVASGRLGLRLRIVDGRLRFYDAGTGAQLRSKAERTDEAESALAAVQSRLAALEARLAELERRQREGRGRA
jgi:hypothetical protein